MLDTAVCTPSPECTNCRGRHACEALQRASLAVLDVVTSNAPHELPPPAVGAELRWIKRAAKMLEARATGLEAQALAMIKRGERVPHFTLGESVTRQVWNVPEEQAIAMGELLGVNVAKAPKALTPKQAMDAGLPEDVVNEISHRPKGALTLVAEDITKARKIFKESK